MPRLGCSFGEWDICIITATGMASSKRNYKWDSSLYRHIADMIDFTNETKNEKYKKFVLDKIQQAKKMAEKGDYRQI